MRNRTNFFRANHENEVETQRSEKLPVKQKCQPLFTRLRRKYCTGYKAKLSIFVRLTPYKRKKEVRRMRKSKTVKTVNLCSLDSIQKEKGG